MFDFKMPAPTIMSITALSNYLREALESDPILQDVWVRGEISNFSAPRSGHLYFNLKDPEALIPCVIWKNAAFRLRFSPSDGQQVEAHGAMSLYAPGGKVQLYIDEMRPAGEGQLFAEFMRLKAKLEAEGLFDEDRKRPIPAYPQHIGVISSPTGAAIQDIFNTLGRRRPDLKLSFVPAAMQGNEAPQEIISALKQIYQISDLDLIIVARGGGSIEDLWAFNNEDLARTVILSPVPVISGVGHETDFTIIDFVADLRAPTPTAAAERASSVTTAEVLLSLQAQSERLTQAMSLRIKSSQQALQVAILELKRTSPQTRVENAIQRLDELQIRLNHAILSPLNKACFDLERSKSQLSALNPRAVLSRGFAILTDSETGKVISHTAQAYAQQKTSILLQDGQLSAQILGKIGEDYDG